jgi:hypothetical protein
MIVDESILKTITIVLSVCMTLATLFCVVVLWRRLERASRPVSNADEIIYLINKNRVLMKIRRAASKLDVNDYDLKNALSEFDRKYVLRCSGCSNHLSECGCFDCGGTGKSRRR